MDDRTKAGLRGPVRICRTDTTVLFEGAPENCVTPNQANRATRGLSTTGETAK